VSGLRVEPRTESAILFAADKDRSPRRPAARPAPYIKNKETAMGMQSPFARPTPDMTEVPYGPEARQVFDFWRASVTPAPALVCMNCGGFVGGGRDDVSADLILWCLEAGFSVVSATTRVLPACAFPAPQHDGARLMQHVRLHAQELGIDPGRLAASGTSAGGGIALWTAYHADLARPDAEDPLLRMSSRPQAVVVNDAQSSYDPRDRDRWFGSRYHWRDLMIPGLTDVDDGDPAALAMLKTISPVTHLAADAPPAMLSFLCDPVPLSLEADMPADHDWVHSPLFAVPLKAKADRLGVEVVIRMHGHWNRWEHRQDEWRNWIAFLRKRL
jgi:acetyl esterase/lipase